uniref:DNA replication complex GINS protein PSF3 n=1 Tax=Ditylenchus dipsaci TaxID=166011 RepID=A0A915D431_9BILA
MASNFAATAPTKLVPVDEEYFDLHTIVSVNSNVKCTFDKNFPLEFFPLVGQKQPHAIPDKGLQIEIPAWMVNAMVVPAAYSSVRRDSIKASSQDTHFQSFQRHFYTLGMHVCKLANGENARAIALALLTAFTQRIEWIIRQSSKVNVKPEKMDELEKRISLRVRHRKTNDRLV